MNIEKLTSEELFIIREGISSLIEKGDFSNDFAKLVELEKEFTRTYQLSKGI